MITKVIKKLIGSRNERVLRRYGKIVAQINALEADIKALDDAALRAKTAEFRQRIASGTSLDDLLVEAFAVVREAAWRSLGQRHYDVQLLGGIILHRGKIAEMRTGEGKTLVATLPCYLNALSGRGVHVITVNDYLAERDANWMRPVYEFLDLTVAINISGMDPVAKRAAYAADITYGTNNEYGFDYLRDNMAFSPDMQVQRGLHYVVIDEVDSILIDEARTPLIISGQAEASLDYYAKIRPIIPRLVKQNSAHDTKDEDVAEADRGDYTIDEKSKQAHLTEQGHEAVESLLVEIELMQDGDTLYDVKNIALLHYVMASLRAHSLFHRDVDYVVKNNEVMIVDEHTGRLMAGRRWSDGLHQAVEAKEGVTIQIENQTLASITFQNYFRLYDKLSGMTGTADTEAFELQSIYALEVIVSPTNRPTQREDRPDLVLLNEAAKYKAVVKEIKERQAKGQPQLVGTASIETSEKLAALLKAEGITHEVLNAKQHAREASIIAQAGRPGAVTIATNMAGRGTDIVLGGNVEVEIAEYDQPSEEKQAELRAAWAERHQVVLDAGGLHVLGTERHESRRIDNQLRGRSGRQGDPGSSQFYLSMEDHLMRIFASDKMQALMKRLNFKEGDVLESGWLSGVIEKAQRRVEGHNFDIRKNLLEFDDVANDQRKIVYEQRGRLLQQASVTDTVVGLQETVVEQLVNEHMPAEGIEEEWDIAGLVQRLQELLALSLPVDQWLSEDAALDNAGVQARVLQALQVQYAEKMASVDEVQRHELEKAVLLQVLDQHWKDHLAMMDHLRRTVSLRSYAQKNPAQEYKRESFDLFSNMLDQFKQEAISLLMRVSIDGDSAPKSMPTEITMHYNQNDAATPGTNNKSAAASNSRIKVGRNDPCTCGSGKKYKHCCGRLAPARVD